VTCRRSQDHGVVAVPDLWDTVPEERAEPFAPGDQVVLREVLRGKVWTARPVTVLRDAIDAIVVLLRVGTSYDYPSGVQPSRLAEREWVSGEWELTTRRWYGHDIVRITAPGQPWDVWWPAPHTKADWYVNFQEPLRRTPQGFDTLDHVLDLVVSRDLKECRWKDVEDFQRAQQLGILSADQAASIQREANKLVEQLAAGDVPWDTSWAVKAIEH
jgi:hypothetical protein